jgi:lipoyl synthase
MAFSGHHREVASCISHASLHTVCVEAKCPNRNECYSKGTATFLIMGTTCTRNCRFCSVGHGVPSAPDPAESSHLAEAALKMGLRYVVITSVTRDDLPDGGASCFADAVRALKKAERKMDVEILIPDFRGDASSLETVLASGPDVLNHNIETIPRLYPLIRPSADYDRSLTVLSRAHARGFRTKSGLMVGLGEDSEEVVKVLKDLREVGCSIVTIGQYLQPSNNQIPVKSYVTPEQFKYFETRGTELGIEKVFAGPFVRSSYQAAEIFNKK